MDPVKIYNYYNDLNWRDSRGRLVKNWKNKIRSAWCKPENAFQKYDTSEISQSSAVSYKDMLKRINRDN